MTNLICLVCLLDYLKGYFIEKLDEKNGSAIVLFDHGSQLTSTMKVFLGKINTFACSSAFEWVVLI